jgi:hypothetical protein
MNKMSMSMNNTTNITSLNESYKQHNEEPQRAIQYFTLLAQKHVEVIEKNQNQEKISPQVLLQILETLGPTLIDGLQELAKVCTLYYHCFIRICRNNLRV